MKVARTRDFQALLELVRVQSGLLAWERAHAANRIARVAVTGRALAYRVKDVSASRAIEVVPEAARITERPQHGMMAVSLRGRAGLHLRKNGLSPAARQTLYKKNAL